MIRPKKLEIKWTEKSESKISVERAKHAELAAQMSFIDAQMSFFDATAMPLEPCPVQFSVRWQDNKGMDRHHECDDWETSTAFNRFERVYGRERAFDIIRTKYEDEYFKAGLALAFSTHSRRNTTFGTKNQWLLVGLIRLNIDNQTDLLLP